MKEIVPIMDGTINDWVYPEGFQTKLSTTITLYGIYKNVHNYHTQ